MARRSRKPMYPTNIPVFNPLTDTPLYYFPVKDVFVRSTNAGGHKLYCGRWNVVMITRDNFLYTYPSYRPQFEQFVEAFLWEYAPHISFQKVKPYLGNSHFEYIGKPTPITV